MKARFTAGIVLLLLFCTFAVVNTSAATLTVTMTADTADGVCDVDCSLREAVAAAAPGDTLTFSSLFNSPQTITLINGQIAFSKNLTITGPGSNLLTVSGNNAGRIFHISGGVVVSMSGMWLRNGRVDTAQEFDGGAILVTGSTLNIERMILSHNLAMYAPPPPGWASGTGGAIYANNTTLSIADCDIFQNTSDFAVFSLGAGSLTIIRSSVRESSRTGISASTPTSVTDTTISDNFGQGIDVGGVTFIVGSVIERNDAEGVRNADGPLTMDRCIIRNNDNRQGLNRAGGGISNFGTAFINRTIVAGNVASGSGGGIANGGRLYIFASAVLNNVALGTIGDGVGGGIFNAQIELYVTNSTISGNRAEVGGGIYTDDVFGTSTLITNSTISFNQASNGRGGGLFNRPTSTLTVRNSIFSNNTSTMNQPNVSGVVISEGFNLVGTTIGSSGWIATDLLNQNPLLAPLGFNGGLTNTHALLPGSPAINAGSNALAVDPNTMQTLMTDQRGFARFVGQVDIGAYEANYSASPVLLSGRVITSAGRGLSGARVVLTEIGTENISYSTTNPFGYFRFMNLPTGTTYNLTALAKFYTFSDSLIVTTDQDRNDLIFLGNL